MTAGNKSKVFECPDCRAPQTEANRLTCRRCGHYLHDKRHSTDQGGPYGAIIGLVIVAGIVGLSCYILLRPHEAPPGAQTQTQSQQATAVSDAQADAGKPVKHRRHRRH